VTRNAAERSAIGNDDWVCIYFVHSDLELAKVNKNKRFSHSPIVIRTRAKRGSLLIQVLDRSCPVSFFSPFLPLFVCKVGCWY
jgi:hypothetical protein